MREGEGDKQTEGDRAGTEAQKQRGSQSREEDGFELQGWNSGIRTLQMPA